MNPWRLLKQLEWKRWETRAGLPRAIILSGLSALLLASSAHAAMYRCTNAAGTTVITDSPAQLRGCSLLGTSQPTTPTQSGPIPAPPLPREYEPEPPHDHQTPASLFSVPLERLGGAEVRNTVATIYDLPESPAGVEGLLGQEFLRHFEVTLNAEKGELRLRSAK